MTPPRYIVLEKPVGQTPLETMTAWKAIHPEYASMPATYAGRLDPMASGKLLVLLGDECKKRDRYTGLDKEYEIEVVLDVATDTGDTLGLAEVSSPTQASAADIGEALRKLRGSHTVPYPAFSSKTVNGKPLFTYALEGTLGTISIPEHKETIYKLKVLKIEILSAQELRSRVENTLSIVPKSDEPSKVLGADFRQNQVRKQWASLFEALPTDRAFTILTLRVTCASGTYMRTLASRLGAELNTTGFALSIQRTKIGRYRAFVFLGFWSKQY